MLTGTADIVTTVTIVRWWGRTARAVRTRRKPKNLRTFLTRMSTAAKYTKECSTCWQSLHTTCRYFQIGRQEREKRGGGEESLRQRLHLTHSVIRQICHQPINSGMVELLVLALAHPAVLLPVKQSITFMLSSLVAPSFVRLREDILVLPAAQLVDLCKAAATAGPRADDMGGDRSSSVLRPGTARLGNRGRELRAHMVGAYSTGQRPTHRRDDSADTVASGAAPLQRQASWRSVVQTRLAPLSSSTSLQQITVPQATGGLFHSGPQRVQPTTATGRHAHAFLSLQFIFEELHALAITRGLMGSVEHLPAHGSARAHAMQRTAKLLLAQGVVSCFAAAFNVFVPPPQRLPVSLHAVRIPLFVPPGPNYTEVL